jgi:phosphoribosylaminoimidazolecarboxamide formyltransferase/IMP cyclohydrolase
MDADAAISIVREFSDPAVAIIKHANPCGAAIGGTIEEAYQKAYEADTVSAYGGIVATNRPITKELATMMSKLFLEVIVAPEIEPEAAQILSPKQNLRILICENNRYSRYEYKKVAGGLLVQDTDRIGICELTEKTGISDTTNRADLDFAWIIAKHVKSNAIVITKNGQTLGIGAGQMSRIESVNIALAKAGEKAKGAVLASDGFFPFSDNVEAAGKYGIKAIVQPGGSIRDPDVIAKSQELGITHYFTGQRHFKH